MYKLKTLISFKHRDGKMRRRNKVFDEADKKYAGRLIGYKLVKVVAIIEPEIPKKERKKVMEKAKEVYKKKIVEPEKNKEEKVYTGGKPEDSSVEEKEEIKPITTDQFKTKKRKSGIIKRSEW